MDIHEIYSDLLKTYQEKCSEEVFNLLNTSWISNTGFTTLILAAQNGYREIVEIIIDKGMDLNIKNHNGDSSLILAAQNGNKEVVEMLINSGADVNARNNDCNTSLIFASGEIGRASCRERV